MNYKRFLQVSNTLRCCSKLLAGIEAGALGIYPGATGGIGIGIGKIGGSAVDAMARQPEMASKIQSAMLIAAGMVEGAGLFALVLALITK